MDPEIAVEQIFNNQFKEILSERPAARNPLKDLLQNHTNQLEIIPPSGEDVWIFGYGSLVWKADFPYIGRERGYICGYQRRFYQQSIDHRGTPSKPGRVVTLVPAGAEDRVYGVAYRIAARQKEDVLKHLDYREKNGYQRCVLPFHRFPSDVVGDGFDIIMYIATRDNESWAGEEERRSLPKIADQIFTSCGPSGTNREYLFNLALAMRQLFPGVVDEHIVELESEVRSRIRTHEKDALESALKREIASILNGQEASEGSPGSPIEIRTRLEKLRSCCERIGWKEFLLSKYWLVDGCDCDELDNKGQS